MSALPLTALIQLVVAALLIDTVTMLLSSFILGLVFGSFLNVVIYRLNPALKLKGGVWSIISGRSFCPNCKTTLKWHDLVPLLSFLWLKGKCRYCNKKISWQYPVVELLSGFLWVGIFNKFGASLIDVYYLFIFSFLLIIAVYDFKWQIIPDKIVYPAIVVALIFNLFSAIGGSASGVEILNFITPLLVALAAFLFFFAFYYFSKGKAMGFGDAKLAFLVGLFLTPLLAILAFALAFIIGAVFGIILMWLGKKTLKSQIAFGPFLVLGAVIAFFFSNFIFKFFQP